ncbi:MAG: hypothetical protein WKF96_24535 [Solirubrobacteraceae bacterium]
MRIPRSRGAVSGVVLVILGAWGALVPLIGPSFDFSTDSTSTWSLTSDTFWLSVVPGVAAVVAGLILLTSANRATAGLAAWLGIAAGAWFVAGDQITGFSVSEAGEFERLAAFEGLGAAIAAVAAFALGRLAVRSVRDEELTREAALADRDRDGDGVPERPIRTDESGRVAQDREPVATNGARSDTLTAADRVREASDQPRSRKLFRRS